MSQGKRGEAAMDPGWAAAALLNAAPDGLFVLVGRDVIRLNPAASTLFGLEHDLDGRPGGLEERVGVFSPMAGSHLPGPERPRDVAELLGEDGAEVLGKWLKTPGASSPGGQLRARGELRLKTRTGGEVVLSAALCPAGDGAPAPPQGQRAWVICARAAGHSQPDVAPPMRDEIATLASGVAHAINNPLSFVVLGLSCLEHDLSGAGHDPVLAARLHRHLSDAHHGAKRIQRFVSSLRRYARKPASAVAHVAVEAALEHALGRVEPMFPANTSFERRYESGLKVTASQERLEELFTELLMNAAHSFLDAASDPRLRLQIGVDEGSVNVTIEDNGCGIRSELLGEVFNPFFSTRPPEEASGLGLSISRRTIEQMGGTLTLDSNASAEHRETGTRLSLRLPQTHVAEAAAVVTQNAQHPPHRKSHVPRDGQRGRVLIVDDESIVTRMLARIVSPVAEAVVCNTGQEAMALFDRGENFDLVLCDLMMPGVTGIELYQRLERRSSEAVEKFVFITGGATVEEAHAFLERVERPTLDKPFEIDALRALLDDYLRRRGRGDSPGS